jgi:hypothetical protein
MDELDVMGLSLMVKGRLCGVETLGRMRSGTRNALGFVGGAPAPDHYVTSTSLPSTRPIAPANLQFCGRAGKVEPPRLA